MSNPNGDKAGDKGLDKTATGASDVYSTIVQAGDITIHGHYAQHEEHEEIDLDIAGRLTRVTLPRIQEEVRRNGQTTISVFISGDNPSRIMDALSELTSAMGLHLTPEGPPELGSWFSRFKAWRKDSGVSDSLIDIVKKAERAAELNYIESAKAQNSEREANAIAALMQAAQNQDYVAIELSSVLIVKTPDMFVARVLTEEQISVLRSNPELLKSPDTVLEELARRASLKRHSASVDGVPEATKPIIGDR